MATGNMSWQFQSQKHLPSYGMPGSSDGSSDMQDMHLKMSKKIAQLTKVSFFYKIAIFVITIGKKQTK